MYGVPGVKEKLVLSRLPFEDRDVPWSGVWGKNESSCLDLLIGEFLP